MPLTYLPSGIRRNNTTIADDGTIVRVTLHQTCIFTYDRSKGLVTLNTGGWNTPTTFRRMNECLHHYNIVPQHRPHFVGKGDFRDRESFTIGVIGVIGLMQPAKGEG